MASTVTTTNVVGRTAIEGSVEKYLNRMWQDLPLGAFDAPLVNSNLGLTATIPKHSGQHVQFRFFDEFTPTYDEYKQNEEPDAGQAVSSSVVDVALKEIVDYADLGTLEADTDIVPLMEKVKELLLRCLKKRIHMLVTYYFVNDISDVGLFADSSTTFSSAAFGTLYAGNVDNFNGLDAGSYVTMDDFVDAVSRLQNDDVPPAYSNGTYAACIDYAVKQQLCYGDPEFRKVWEASEKMAAQIGAKAQLPSYANCTWILQSNAVSYRTDLPDEAGAEGTPALGTGKVHYSHILGGGEGGARSFAYVDLAGPRRLRPKWKVQDITTTGVKTTIAFRVPFRCAVLRSGYGLNLAGTSKFDKGVSD